MQSQFIDSGLRLRRSNSEGVDAKYIEKDQPLSVDESVSKPYDITNLLLALSLVFGGCCTNVWSIEELLRTSSQLGTAITFGQVLFITCQSLPHFVTWNREAGGILSLPKLAPLQVPIHEWTLQVFVLISGTLLNNWSFAYDVPLTLQIVFRSSGLPVSMFFGYFFLGKKYSSTQMMSVLLVTAGVVLATITRPSTSNIKSMDEPSRYFLGISMIATSLLLTGLLGVLQERTYKKYGPCWKEGVFYTHLLSLPTFIFLAGDIRRGAQILGISAKGSITLSRTHMVLFLNLITQLICVSGVNQLTSRVSSVSTNFVLTVRKAISLCLSVWLFKSSWNAGLALGAGMVFLGSVLYTMVSVKPR